MLRVLEELVGLRVEECLTAGSDFFFDLAAHTETILVVLFSQRKE
jgi:hypothetical protein